MSTDSQNTSTENTLPENALPSADRDYYYRYRISEIEKIKAEYNSIFNVIEANKSDIFKSYLNGTDGQSLDGEAKDFMKKLKELKKDFNSYAENIINKSNITSNEDFTYNMENLMLVVNATVLHCEDSIILNKKVNRKKKYEYDGKKLKLKDIVGKFKNIPYELDQDNLFNIIFDRYQFIIFPVIMTMALCFLIYAVCVIAQLFNKNAFVRDLLIFSGVLVSIIFVVFLFVAVIRSKVYRMTEEKSKAYVKNEYIVYKPFEKIHEKRYGKYGRVIKLIWSLRK